MSNQKKAAVSRIARDGSKIILQSDAGYYVYSLRSDKVVGEPQNSLTSLVASGGWRRPTTSEETEFLSGRDTVMPTTISEQEAQEILDEEMMRNEIEFNDVPDDYGDDEVYEFNEEYDFYAVPFGDNPEEVSEIYALDPEDEATLFHWDKGEFMDASEEEFDSAEMARWVIIDKDTAQYIAKWYDHHGDEDFCLIHAADPGEKALFDSAESEIDWDFVHTLSNIVADASGYSSAERSQNAQRQRRGPGGRFARTPGKSDMSKTPEKKSASSVIRTYLPGNFTFHLTTNPIDIIAKVAESAGTTEGAPPAVFATGDIVGKEAQEATRPTEEEKKPAADIVYFAVVDPKDNRAVQSLIAITKDAQGVPQAWNRNNGEWKISPDAMADLQSITPPPLVLLEDEEILKTVLRGIDAYDAEGGAPVPEEGAEAPVVADAYTSEDRSRNALRQRRGPDGRFVPQGSEEMNRAIENRNSYVVKTFVPNSLVGDVVQSPRQFIEDHFIPLPEVQEPEHESEAIELAEGPSPEFSLTQMDSTQFPENTLYFAIVGKEDHDEVYNMIAFTFDDSGISGWFRNNGTWEQSEDVYTDFVNDTLPTLRLLTPEQATDIAIELDDFDRASHDFDSFATETDIQRGYARYDGSFNIQSLDDVYNAVLTCSNNAPDDVKLHIAKRARSFNRMDIVPEQWRALAYVSQNAIFGDYGEVIVAAGGKRRGNEETLKEYWANGKGAAKIGWGGPNDMTKCIRHLTKYIGPDAPGFCQNLHMRKFGQSNYKRDNG